MDKQGGHKSPEPALREIVEAEEQVLLGKLGILLPSPEARHYASEYEESVDSQLTVIGSSWWSLPDVGVEDEGICETRRPPFDSAQRLF